MKTLALTVFGLMALTMGALASADTTVTLTIKDHRFVPSEITVPAGEKVKLVVKNNDKTPEEFESHSLHQEKVIFGGREVTLKIPPLEPGKYEFMGEFHPDTARGVLIAE